MKGISGLVGWYKVRVVRQPVLVVVGALTEKKYRLEGRWILIAKQFGKVAQGRYILASAGELVIDLLRGDDLNRPVAVAGPVCGESFSLSLEIRMRDDEEVWRAHA